MTYGIYDASANKTAIMSGMVQAVVKSINIKLVTGSVTTSQFSNIGLKYGCSSRRKLISALTNNLTVPVFSPTSSPHINPNIFLSLVYTIVIPVIPFGTSNPHIGLYIYILFALPKIIVFKAKICALFQWHLM